MFGYIVTELCECNLDTFVSQLRKSGAVNQRLAMSVARDMLEGVHYLHQRGIRIGRLKVRRHNLILLKGRQENHQCPRIFNN